VADAVWSTADNLYLDMNGIIHHCTHANKGEEDVEKLSQLSETEMFTRIFQYIDRLFQIVRPRKVFYMAIDGSYLA
jgi:5'-3' exoribonuclease 1